MYSLQNPLLNALLKFLLNRDLIDVSCIIAWIVLLLPTGAFLFFTWRNRRDFLFTRLPPHAIRRYYEQFFPLASKNKSLVKGRPARTHDQPTVPQIFARAREIRCEREQALYQDLVNQIISEFSGGPFPPVEKLTIPEQDAHAPEEDWSAGLSLIARGIQQKDWNEVARGIVLSLEQTERYERERGPEGTRDKWHNRVSGIEAATAAAVGKWTAEKSQTVAAKVTKVAEAETEASVDDDDYCGDDDEEEVFDPEKERKDQELVKKFKKDFGRLYGRRHFVWPVVFLGVFSGLGLFATSRSIHAWLGVIPRDRGFSPIVISAFLGAFAWVLSDQLRRFRTGDFTAHDAYGGTYRFLIAIPLGISLASFARDDVGIGIAFLLGAFPTTSLFTIARRLVNKQFGVGETQENGSLELEKLQCVGRSNAERYVDEGITTIAELAWADPIDLTIRTNRQLNFVVDSVSQALLWVYFEDRVKQLYPLSLRGAQEVCTLMSDLKSKEPKKKAAAKKNLAKGAEVLKMDKESFLYTLVAVKDDPYAKFLFDIWT
jgi:hypothetical protein